MVGGAISKYLGFQMKSQIKNERKRLSKYAKTHVNITHMDIDGCHRLPLGRSIANTAKRAIFKLANKKHSEAMLQQKGILM